MTATWGIYSIEHSHIIATCDMGNGGVRWKTSPCRMSQRHALLEKFPCRSHVAVRDMGLSDIYQLEMIQFPMSHVAATWECFIGTIPMSQPCRRSRHGFIRFLLVFEMIQFPMSHVAMTWQCIIEYIPMSQSCRSSRHGIISNWAL